MKEAQSIRYGGQFESCFNYVRDDVAQSIVFTDWAGEFQRLENLELTRVK